MKELLNCIWELMIEEPDDGEDEVNSTMFPRHLYYSQSEVCTKYQITPRMYQELLVERNIPQVNKVVDLGGYTVTTRYVLKEDVESLNLNTR